MKKLFLTAALAAAVVFGAGAKTADELRIYINPGHGGWTANDRPCTLVGHGAYQRVNTDTLSFFESNTDLERGFGLLEALIGYGLKFDRTLNQTNSAPANVGAARDLSNNIVMSRVKNGPYHEDNGTKSQLGDATPKDIYAFNRNLDEICAEVEANNFDMFVSMHSNAAGEGTTTNFPLVLYRGYDNCKDDVGNLNPDFQQECRDMGAALWPYLIGEGHQMWTAYSATQMNIRGDINFYGSSSTVAGCKGYLGVLKHTVPGFLCEHYFHTYQPARHRAMNFEVDRAQGVLYARGIADYFGLQKEKTGMIYGIVRDLHEKFTDAAYKPNPSTDDAYKPLNGVTVALMKGSSKVAEYTTDGYYNGAFLFTAEPGDYTLVFTHPDYKTPDPVAVTVKAAETVYPTATMESNSYVPPAIVYENYPDPLEGNKGMTAAGEYVFRSELADVAIPQLEGKKVRRVVAQNGRLFILALDKDFTYAAKLTGDAKPVPTLIVYDTKTQAVTEVSTEGMHGSILDASDLQVTSDGYLLASNLTKTQYSADYVESGDEGRGTFIVYKWEKDDNGLPTGKPVEWMSTDQSGRWFRAYPGHFCYTGTSQDGKIFVTMPTITAPAYKMRSTTISVVGGVNAGSGDHLSPGDYGENVLGNNYTMITSPNDKDYIYVIGENGVVRKWQYGWADKSADFDASNEELLAVRGNGRAGAFRYGGASYLVMPAGTDEGNTGVSLFDVTKDPGKAAVVSTVNTTVELANTANVAVTGESVAVRDAQDVITGAFINLYMVRDGKLTKFTTNGVAQPVNRKEYAYALNGKSIDKTNYEVSYSLTGDAADVAVVLTPAEGDEVVFEQGAQTAGAHTYNIDLSALAENVNYNWGVRVTSKPNAQAGEVSSDANGLTVRGGVNVITDPEYDSFGYVAVGHGAAKGIDVYDPSGKKIATRVHKGHATFGGSANTNQSDPFRGAEREGKVIFAGWGDKSEGLIGFDPANPTAEPFPIFAGTHQSNGNHILDGVNLGGGNSGVGVVGTGENTYIYMFSEDHENGNGGGATENTLVRYKVGTSWVINTAPEVIGYKSMLANTNVDVLGYGDGVFVSQVRGAGNNQSSVPVAMYIDADDEVTFNSADLYDEENGGLTGGSSGVAITRDGKTFAIADEAKNVKIYSVEWNGSTPKMTFQYNIAWGNTGWSNLRFDFAGNLHAYQREQGGYHTYALVDSNPVVTTPAKKALVISNASGVSDITVENATNGEAVYYNLSGVRVAAENLQPGVYVKVQNGKSTKVVIK